MEYLAIALFAVSTCITPGPNNIMIMTSGLNFGIRRSLNTFWYLYGLPVMIIVVGLGIAEILKSIQLHTALKIIGVSYLTFLAWKIATSPFLNTGKQRKPLLFYRPLFFSG